MKYMVQRGVLVLTALLCLTVGAAARECTDCRYERPEPTVVQLEAGVELLGQPGDPLDLGRKPEKPEEADFEAAWETFRDGVWSGWTGSEDERYIDISEYELPWTEETREETHNWLDAAINHAPDMFALEKWQYYTLTYGGEDSRVVLAGIRPIYREEFLDAEGALDSAKYEAAKKDYVDGIQDIVDQVDPNWCAEEQLLFVHDYLAVHFEYDMRVYDPELAEFAIYDVYHFLQHGTGVCQAYTMTYMAVLQELGFEVSYVESDHLNHVWNLVKVGPNWYHVDVTWDDPTEDMLGFAQHRYFLLNDQYSWLRHKHDGVENTDTPGHRYDWVYGVKTACLDGRYNNAFWNDAISPFVFEEETGLWYFVSSTGLRAWDVDAGTISAPLDTFEDIRLDVSGGYFECPDEPGTAGLSLYDGKLFYNSRYTVRSYDLETGAAETLLTLDWAHVWEVPGGYNLSEKQCMLSLRVDDGTLGYETYSFETELQQYAELTVASRFTPVGDGVYSYCVEEDTLELRVDHGKVLVVAYDGSGAMTDMMICEISGTYDLPEGTVKLFAVDGETGWDPQCKDVAL